MNTPRHYNAHYTTEGMESIHRSSIHRSWPFLVDSLPWLAVALFFHAAPPVSHAAEFGTHQSADSEMSNPHVWMPATKSVSVFKNGLGFFTREGKVELSGGWGYAREVPPAAFGTLAVYARSEQQAVDIVGAGPGEIVAFDGHDAPRDTDSKRQRLEPLVGLQVELHYAQHATKRLAAGALLSIGEEYVVLEAATQTLAVLLREITRLQVLDMPLRVHVRQEDETTPQDAELGIAYLRNGIMWIPEYTLNVIDEETAELTLRGTLVNEAEDLVHCDVNFVVGVPHFVHSDLMSPIAVGRMIRTLGSSLPVGGVPQQIMSQMMNRAAIANNAMTAPQADASESAFTEAAPIESDTLSDVMNNLPQLENAAAGDFTVYTKPNLTVRKGERVIVTLFTQKIRYRHLYRLELPGPIEHYLTLENNTNTAWTTGPCLALSGGSPLSEDVLKYTPRGGEGELQVTTAINIATSSVEEEVERQLKEHSPRNNDFLDLVTVGGKIRLKNFEERAVEIIIETPINGRPTEADHDGMIRMDASHLRLVERSGSIRWRLTLEPEQEIELTYRYERYVPSN